MLWFEKLFGVQLGLWGWILDFMLVGLGAALLITSRRNSRLAAAGIVAIGTLVFIAVYARVV